MTDDADSSATPPAAIPWYKSQVLRYLAIVAVTHTLTHYKLISQFTPDDIGQFVDGCLSALGYIATAGAAYVRIAKPIPVITTTKARAQVINSSSGVSQQSPKSKLQQEKTL